MEKSGIGPTPYEDVNAVLAALLAEVRGILGERLAGMYLYGSLSLGDYDPPHSDVDFIAVTAGALGEDKVRALGEMHMRFQETEIGGLIRLEGCYMPLADLRRHNPEGGPYPMLNEGEFKMTPLGGDWVIQRHVVRECGVVVYGPEPRGLIDAVGPDELRWGVAEVLGGWWREQADTPDWIGQQVEFQVFTVQTMCRALYTLARGEIASKPVSVRWAIETLGEPWRSTADRALCWKDGEPFVLLAEVIAMVRYAIEQSRAYRQA